MLPEELGRVVGDPLGYNRMLGVVGRYSLATVTPTTVSVHRLIQAVIRARLDDNSERHWAEIAVGLLRASFPDDSGEVPTWPTCERLLPHSLAVTGHAERLGVAGVTASWLLDRASTYLSERGQYLQAKPIAERALAIGAAALGPDHLEVATWRCNLGSVLWDLGDLEGARVQLERALEVSEAVLGVDQSDVAIWRGNLGSVLQALQEEAPTDGPGQDL